MKVISIGCSIWQHLLQHFITIVSSSLDELTQSSPVQDSLTGQGLHRDRPPGENTRSITSLALVYT